MSNKPNRKPARRPGERARAAQNANRWVVWAALGAIGRGLPRPRPRFAHGLEVPVGSLTVMCSYHPSQQNTFTGRLTREMLDAVFVRCAQLTGR